MDNQGGALEGVPVQLSIDNPERTGAALTTTSVVTTDAQGQIEAGVVLGAGSVNARLNHDIVVTAQIVTPPYDENGNSNLEVRATEEIILQATGTSIEVETTDANLTGVKLLRLQPRLLMPQVSGLPMQMSIWLTQMATPLMAYLKCVPIKMVWLPLS